MSADPIDGAALLALALSHVCIWACLGWMFTRLYEAVEAADE